jgi:hypothetical protein
MADEEWENPWARVPRPPRTTADSSAAVAGPAAPSGASGLPSVAREYRRRRDHREAPYKGMVIGLVVLAAINFSAYYGLNLPSSGAVGGPSPPSGVPDNVTLGAASLQNTTCGDGKSMVTESVPWVNASIPPTTDQVFLEIIESLDGDVDGGPAPAPTVTATSVCAAAPLTIAPSWYVVLRSPMGPNVAVFSYSTNWVVLSGGAYAPIQDGSVLVLVADPGLSGRSFTLCALGGPSAPDINACATL